jgi:two-component system LytT family response regulator
MSTAPVIRTVIADDERAARAKLLRLLAAHPDIKVVAEVETGVGVIDAIRIHRPDLVLLDIRMPEIDGFSAIRTFDRAQRPIVIFVTAYDTHAVGAFAQQALDYLLKPYDADRLAVALERVRGEVQRRAVTAAPDAAALEPHLAAALADERDSGSYLNRIAIRKNRTIEVIDLKEVERMEADGNYVILHSPAGTARLRQTIRALVDKLDPERFQRVHRRAIVRVDAVVRVTALSSGDSTITLRSGAEVRLSRSFRHDLVSRLRH